MTKEEIRDWLRHPEKYNKIKGKYTETEILNKDGTAEIKLDPVQKKEK